ncbi:hypothetical protein BD408DRAFT_429650 [Parasitella parasitica]|nr:hypothetical protein BD408DRAFT_429650 [Parasitella parasitica]
MDTMWLPAGGNTQFIPKDEPSLHLMGDLHADIAANNLLSVEFLTRECAFIRLCPARNAVPISPPVMKRCLAKSDITKAHPDDFYKDEIVRYFVKFSIYTP